MSSSDLPLDQLGVALARTAAGHDAHEAALRLLTEHGGWISRLAHAGVIELDDDDPGDRETERLGPAGERYAWIRWPYALDALEEGRLHAGSSAGRVLRTAASLASDSTVNLADTVSDLDLTDLTLVLAALSHAAGLPEHLGAVTGRSTHAAHPPPAAGHARPPGRV